MIKSVTNLLSHIDLKCFDNFMVLFFNKQIQKRDRLDPLFSSQSVKTVFYSYSEA